MLLLLLLLLLFFFLLESIAMDSKGNLFASFQSGIVKISGIGAMPKNRIPFYIRNTLRIMTLLYFSIERQGSNHKKAIFRIVLQLICNCYQQVATSDTVEINTTTTTVRKNRALSFPPRKVATSDPSEKYSNVIILSVFRI